MTISDEKQVTSEPLDRRRNGTRDRLVDVSLTIFARQGYAGTTISEIEKSVGLKPGSGAMYRHFESKEALLLAAIRAYHERLRDVCNELRALGPAPDAKTDLTRIVEALGIFLAREHHMVLIGLDAAGLPDSVRLAIGATWEEGYSLFAETFVDYDFSVDDAQVMAVASLGSLNHYLVQTMGLGSTPNSVSFDRYVMWWVAHWTNVLERNPG
jgi:AcrR family transcriptional regulator